MKKVKILLIALILVLGGAFLSNTYAATRNLKAQLERPFTNSKYQYLVPGDTTDLQYTVVKIYDADDKVENEFAYNNVLYCLRGGVGFGSEDVNTNDSISYTELAEMHLNAKEVIAKYKELYNVDLDRAVTINGTEINLYNAILWVLDESYLPKDIVKDVEGTQETVYNALKYKEELLDKAGVPTVQQNDITDDDLEVIQQLAIWYFANYDEQKAGTKPTVSQRTIFPAQFLRINGDNNISDTKANNLDRIYQYLVFGAIDNAGTYNIDSTTGARTKTVETNEFAETTLTIAPGPLTGPMSYYEIGPFEIKSDVNSRTGEETVDATSIVLYDANDSAIDKDYKVLSEDEQPGGTVEYNQLEHNIYIFIDEQGNMVKELRKGEAYYIRFYKAFEKGSKIIPYITENEQYDVSKVKLKITSSYTLATANFLFATQNSSNNQAVVELVKEKVSEPSEITTKYYDLALRKFITSINGNILTGTSSRVPKIDLSKLNTLDARTNKKITTATYTHPKNALLVEIGDKVIYTIRIYNEGQLDGKALEITDYLPTGLQLASESEINEAYGWVAGEGNKITTEYLKDTVIKAYDSNKTSLNAGETGWQKAATGTVNSGLYYADVQVECEVVAQVSTVDQNLRNIAEISNDDGNDRDSNHYDPDRVYSDGEHTPGSEENGYYPGEQDDDDYEDLVLKAKEFDLSLRKFITKVQRGDKELPLDSREPVIKIKGLKSGEDTATYIHPKDTLSLKRGDIITYTIRVYNEGQLNGYALQVKDYLPEGLELVEGQNDIWTANGNTLTTDALKNELLLGYDKNTTSVEDGVKWQKASDDESGLYYYDLTVVCKIKDNVTDGAILKNVAEISSDKSEPTDIPDRDSTPENVYDDQVHNPKPEVNGYTPGEEDDDDFEKVTVEPNEVFDLSLRKYITKVEGAEVATREPEIIKDTLNNGTTTAEYKHRKDPVEVETGNKVTYKITIYNEGELAGRATKVVDQLPAGLKFTRVVSGNYEVESYDEGTNKLTLKETTNNGNLEAYNKETKELKSTTIEIECEVTEKVGSVDKVLTNIAWISEAYNAETETTIVAQEGADRDSEPGTAPNKTAEELRTEDIGYTGKDSHEANKLSDNVYYKGQQDDDDFEKIIIKGIPFDLSLRKFITSIKRNGEELEFADRTPSIDTTTLINGTYNRNGVLEHTATYEHSKEPLLVKQGDIITYTLRIYNEGERAGYATEITDYIPEGLALILNYNTNFENEWKLPDDFDYDKTMNLVGENGFYKTEDDVKNLKLEDFEVTTSLNEVQLVTGKVNISTNLLDNELLKEFDKTLTKETAGEGWQKADAGEGGLYYKDIQVSCLVIAENSCTDVLTNIAEISEDKDEFGNDVYDDDSIPDNVTDKNEDDDDYEPVVLRYFDLALRKFITGVETNGKLTEVTSRVPNLSIDEKTGNIKYTHPKQEVPVEVANNDIVIYTLRVYNEGTLAGYAEEITDDIPEGLIFLPEHDVNKQYEWKMFDKDGNATDNLEDADKIKTEYLSKAREIENRDNLIEAFDSSKELAAENPHYKDIKVAFRVIEPNTSDRIIVNSAQISEDSDDDDDSIPNEWNNEEDDQDKEYIYVKYFDLSLLKWVTQTIVTVDGKTTTTETGFKPNTGLTETTGIRDNEENEPVAKVELDRKKLNKTTVKFAYKIRVTNEGEIAGYATEITDFIPKGLEFKAEDNKKYGWVKEGEDKVTTRALETVLLEPGESTELEIVFTWINDKENLGVKTNIAEITEDYNENNSKDIDSTPENKEDPYEKEQEDDDDFALVVLSIKTGKGASYTILITAVVAMLATGIYLIKKYVLTY